jgi:serine/threonine-protein kinase ATR
MQILMNVCADAIVDIRTYGVTPLNEECGTIEWVDKLKPMRDIVIQLYRQKNVKIDVCSPTRSKVEETELIRWKQYGELRLLLAEACAEPKNLHIYTERILPQ